MKEFDNLKDILNSYKNIIISAHVNPDADSVGSSTALALVLKKLGKNVVVILEEYGDKYSFINNTSFLYHNIREMDNFENELFISLDCGDELRLGEFIVLFNNAKATINIDHHVSNTYFAKYNYVLEKSSTCEIIYELIMHLDISMDVEIAKSLYTGILADTGGFKHPNTTSRTHEIAAELIKYEFSHTKIHQELFEIHSYESTKTLGKTLDRMELFFDGKVASSYITQQDMKEFNVDKSQLGGIIDNLINIKGVMIAIFVYEKDDNESKVSMRSTNMDICNIVIEFGGGGHSKACGCTINAKAKEAQNMILEKIKNQLI